MALDGIFLFHLKNEVADFAVGSRIEKIHQPSKEEIILSLHSREGAKKLLLSCRADTAGIYFTSYPPENPSKPPTLCMLLRKHLNGAKIISVEQDGLERIVKIKAVCTNELGDSVKFNLICEIMGKYSNIILTNEKGIIIDSLKKVDENKSHIRQILPGEKYVSPPPQDKLNIFSDDINEIKSRIYASEKSPAKAFQDAVMGVSPIVCREFESGVSLLKIKEYAEKPKPVAVITDKLLDFAFMPVKQYGNLAKLKYFDSFSKTLDYFYYEKVKTERINQQSGELFKTLQKFRERAVRKAEARKQELKECGDKEKYKIYGDLIISNQYALQKGSLFYDLHNYYDNDNIIRIPADPAETPMQNAQRYYKEYRKKQTAQAKLSGFILQAENEARYLDSVIDSLSRADSSGEISEIKSELTQTGFLKRRNYKNSKSPKALKPKEYISTDGFKISVGRNNLMNDKLTLKTAKKHDLWFHIKDGAGSHVIVANNGFEFTDEVIREAAMLAAYNSKAKNSSNVAVDYTLVKNVKKPNGAKPGMVVYDNYKTEYVTPNEDELERIKRIV